MTKKCPRSRFEMGQIMTFWFWQRLCLARPVLWLWNECRKRSKQRQRPYTIVAGKAKWEFRVLCAPYHIIESSKLNSRQGQLGVYWFAAERQNGNFGLDGGVTLKGVSNET